MTTVDGYELGACEKCGRENIIAYDDESGYGVRCEDCGYWICMDDLESSVDWWNTRAIEDALRAELAQARARIAQLEDEWKLMSTLLYDAHGPGYLWLKSKV